MQIFLYLSSMHACERTNTKHKQHNTPSLLASFQRTQQCTTMADDGARDGSAAGTEETPRESQPEVTAVEEPTRSLRPRRTIRPPKQFDEANFDLSQSGLASVNKGRDQAAQQHNEPQTKAPTGGSPTPPSSLPSSSPPAPPPASSAASDVGASKARHHPTASTHSSKRSTDDHDAAAPASGAQDTATEQPPTKRGKSGGSGSSGSSGSGKNNMDTKHDDEEQAEGGGGADADSNDDEDEEDAVYCLCRQPDDGRMMVFCDSCHEWFHVACVGLTKKKAENLSIFFCPPCKEILEGNAASAGSAKSKKKHSKAVGKGVSPKSFYERQKRAKKAPEAAETTPPRSPPAPPPPAELCTYCKDKPKRKEDAYCSDECAAQAASDTFMELLGETDTAPTQPTTAAPAPPQPTPGSSSSSSSSRRKARPSRPSRTHTHASGDVAAFRDVSRNNLHRVVSDRASSSSSSGVGDLDIDAVVAEIEKGAFLQHSDNKKRYLATIRRLVSHIRDPDNDLLHRIASGEVKPVALASLKPEELASKQLDLNDPSAYFNEPPVAGLGMAPPAAAGAGDGDGNDANSNNSGGGGGAQQGKQGEQEGGQQQQQQQQPQQGGVGSNTGSAVGTPRTINVVTAVSKFKWDDDDDDDNVGGGSGGYGDDDYDDGFGDGGATPPGTPPCMRDEQDDDAELLRSMTESVFADLSRREEETAAGVWSGTVSMPEVASVQMRGQLCFGPSADLANVLGSHIKQAGRIRPAQVWSYIGKLRKTASKTYYLVALTPETDDDEMPFVTLFEYFRSRDRLGVCGEVQPSIKDAYLLPMKKGEQLPAELQKLRLKQTHALPDADHLLAVIISNERSSSSSSTRRRSHHSSASHHHRRHRHHHHRKGSRGSATHTPTETDTHQAQQEPVEEYTPGQILL
ncbi:hypothetical protein PTSG_10753 [Salpingoeca rosetta]|uniref:Transcription factor BYE1 n=1 Tax=Salpingoeca rosetta (strain ATCC 50818 / BSB-021) TaxID=946362 RepID=F2UQA0_SALR5|nr:uncharacterized protein PTSG_10753 [Salpingoeca rosetta]EGD79768.1 hypothetical protein PTSG_10753 [Salpingoeca rosetta]|eukprot:XP_004988717.1 hypothetical protein PTSG_10753 [Salpingoeca rosetta]